MTPGGWRPSASLDPGSRRRKAAKIVSIVESERSLESCAVLEIGTGGGIIASVLAERAGPQGLVASVDVVDLRTTTEGYEFHLVEGSELPFEDSRFDVVVSNHTIEHVGDDEAQGVHLAEIRRVLRPEGIAYLATPTRWAPVEPHFKVPLLSWLPERIRTAALRLTRRGSVYDIHPRSRRQMRRMIRASQLEAEDRSGDAARALARAEWPDRARRLADHLPGAAWRLMGAASPTMIYLLRRR